MGKMLSLQPQATNMREVIEMTEKLLEWNKKLENERSLLIQDVKKQVQQPGSNVLHKFSSFGCQAEAEVEKEQENTNEMIA